MVPNGIYFFIVMWWNGTSNNFDYDIKMEWGQIIHMQGTKYVMIGPPALVKTLYQMNSMTTVRFTKVKYRGTNVMINFAYGSFKHVMM